MNFLGVLEKTLRQDDRFVGEGERILKTKVYDACMGMDRLLLKSLVTNETLKSHFFEEINGVLVFDKMKFAWVLESREFLPDSFTMFKNKIGLADSSQKLLSRRSDVVLIWPYKDCMLEGGQTKEDQKRDEIFYNEVLAPDEINRLLYPKVFTNAKRYLNNSVEKITEIKDTDNLIIKGNNLLALASLLKRYKGKVKCIYIDPPFNTGSDSFKYNDKFNHSTWLTFMRNRISLARKLLSDDGCMFVHLDDNENTYCKVLMDEIFGPENYLNQIVVSTNQPFGYKSTSEGLFKQANHILFYAKDKSNLRLNAESMFIERAYDTNYKWVFKNTEKDETEWYWENIRDVVARKLGYFSARDVPKEKENKLARQVSEYAIQNASKVFRTASVTGGALNKRKETIAKSRQLKDVIVRHPNDDMDYMFIRGERVLFYSERLREIDGYLLPGKLITDIWTDIPVEGLASEGNVSFPKGKKPERLIKRIIKLVTKPNDIILDYHLGSGTTAAVAHKLSRQYIGIEQIYYGENDSVTRLKNVIEGDATGISNDEDVKWTGGNSFVYCELMEQNESIVSALQTADKSKEVQAILNRVTDDGLIIPSVLPDDLRSHMDEFAQMSLKQQKTLVMELIDKNKLYVNLCDIDDEELAVSNDDKAFTRNFYRIDGRGDI